MTANTQNKQFFDEAARRAGTAFPVNTANVREHGACEAEHGMTLRQYAAISLRVPNSGDEWLDAMILSALRDEFAAKFAHAQVISAGGSEAAAKAILQVAKKAGRDIEQHIARSAYGCADTMIAERAK